MAQSLFGEGGKRGISEEKTATGLILGALSMRATEEQVLVEDHIGEVTGLSLGNQSAEITASGVTVTEATQTMTLGAAMGTLTNNAGIFTTETDVTELFITEIAFERASKTYEEGSFTAMGWAGLTDTIATEQA